MPNEAELVEYLRRMTTELRQAHRRIRTLEEQAEEPIAVVGMACRLPGADSPDALWQLLDAGRDAIVEMPADRGWDIATLYHPDPDHPGTSYVRHGGFLPGAADFDADFFGISPREALAMDPQQRLLLESAWEAVEQARIDPASLRDSRTGVFAGVMYHDYASRPGELSSSVEGYLSTGVSGSVASGRIAYTLGLRGPAMTIDTACSSSLVALHLAARSLRAGECDLALASGVTVMGTPTVFVELSRQRGLAADGRCKSFSDDADGTGWAEGVATVLVERLSDARRNGHPVLAVIRGSAVNSDGASNGLTAPNGPAQQRVIRDALAAARLDPADVDAVEAHGTGTSLGDPIEAQAVLDVYGAEQRDRPLWLGSLKSNLGHTQAAAGTAALIKVILALRHEQLPRTLHVSRPTTRVDWDGEAVRLLTDPQPWPSGGRPRRAGISSFGISGTNAHLIVEEPPAAEPTEPPSSPVTLPVTPVPISAASAAALARQAGRLAERPAGGTALADVAFSLAASRAALPRRAVVLAAGPEQLGGELAALAAGEAGPLTVAGAEAAGEARAAFLFTGQGAQRAGMAAELAAAFPEFDAGLDEVCAALDPHLPRPLRPILAAGPASPDSALLDDTLYTQTGTFAVQVALYRFLERHGLRPAAVAGHSVGELAAAHVAGVLTLADAAELVAARGRLMSALPAGGAMAGISATEDEVLPLLTGHEGIALAAVNGPRSVVVSGDAGEVDRIVAHFAGQGRRTRRLDVSHAFHSPRMDPILDEFAAVAARLSFGAPAIPIVSGVTGTPLGDATWADPGYWTRQIRDAVRFHDAVAALRGTGVPTFLEIGPDAVLTPAVHEITAEDPNGAVVCAAVLRRDRSEPLTFFTALAELWVRGVAVDWASWFAGTGARRIDLPTYPFQRERYWLQSRPGSAGLAASGMSSAGHPLLGASVSLAASGGMLLTGRLETGTQPWLADHAFGADVLLPGTAFVELALRGGEQAGLGGLDGLTVQRPLPVPPDGVAVQVAVGAADADGSCPVSVHAQDEDGTWVRHAAGTLVPVGAPPAADAAAWPPPGADPVPAADVYAILDAGDLRYGPAFRGLRGAWRSGEDIYAEVALPGEVEPGTFALHPALADAALHGLVLLSGAAAETRVPFAFDGVRLYTTGATVLRVRIRRTGPDTIALDAAGEDGRPVLSVGALTLHRAGPAPVSPVLHRLTWIRATLDADAGDYRIVEWPAKRGDLPQAVHTATERALALLQEVLASDDQRPVVLVTRHAVAIPGVDTVADPVQAAVRALAASAQSERPDRILLVDTDGTDASRALIPAAAAHGGERVALRDGTAWLPRLVPAESGTAPAGDLPLPQDGRAVLITGGTGTLGARFARHLAGPGRRLVLTSRRGPDAPGVAELVTALRAAGSEVDIVACDIGDPGAVAALLDAHPVGAVVHAAGVLHDATVATLEPAALHEVLTPKVDGAVLLDRLTRDLTMFVVFSSAAGVLGPPGQANYAAANACLDALAQERRGRGRPARSIAWGAWADDDGGMTATLDGARRRRLESSGIVAIEPGEGLELFTAAVTGDETVPVPIRLDRAALRAQADAGTLPALFSALAPVRHTAAPGGGASFAATLRTLDPADRFRATLDLVRTSAAAVLGHATAAAVEPERSFRSAGFDSLAAIELRNALSAATGLRLPVTLVFDHPSPVALAEMLLAELTQTGEQPSGEDPGRSARGDDPVAVVGLACRLPGGVTTPEELWQLLRDGVDAVGEWPADRGWDSDTLYDPDPAHPGTSYSRHGGFLYDAAEFDPEFFGISPREALAMDPQQRLLLETAWEAVEHAGIDPVSLRGTATGVFAGAMYHDYGGPSPEVEGYTGTGSAGSVVSGRVAYTLGLQGPAITIDTACSSSLVALHLAVRSLRDGECDLALAAGVTVMATPGTFVELSRQRAMSPDGRCRSFSEDADGTGWAEGAATLLVERLSDARRLGHPVLAVIRGSAVNSDGASNGLTAPNGPAQQRVIRAALADAGLRAEQIDAVEAHGTGTSLGDPIEAQALIATYGRDRDRPLWLGSLKSNLGHTQAAAGAAAVIKTVLALRHRTLPRTLHVSEPSSRVDWSAAPVSLLTAEQPWEPGAEPRRAGISSFGISGTNAHLIIEEPAAAPAEITPDGAGGLLEATADLPFVLSASAPAALRAQAGRLSAFLREHPSLAPSVAAALPRRTRFPYRAVPVGVTGLAAYAESDDAPAPARGEGRTAFVFPGQGSQWPLMAAGLLDAEPVFRAEIERCDQALLPYTGWSLTGVLRGNPEAPPLDRVDVVQPALFAVMAGLAALWQACGVRPAAVIGHSQGEIAAAYVAGALSLDDAARVVALRSRAIAARLAGRGAMASVTRPAAEVAGLIAEHGWDLDIAAVNGPGVTVVAGAVKPTGELLRHCERAGIRARKVPVDYASHSPQVADIETELGEALAGLYPRDAAVPFLSTVTGELLDTSALDGGYWYRNLRRTVRFDDAVTAALARGIDSFLEISPHPVLIPALADRTGADGETIAAGGTLRRGEGGPAWFLAALGEHFARGGDVAWNRVLPTAARAPVELPAYAFQRRRFWLNAAPGAGPGAAGLDDAAHPLLAAQVPLPGDGVLWTGRIGTGAHPWLADHRIGGTVLMPGTAFVELAVQAGAAAGTELLRELTLHQPLVLRPGATVAVRVSVDAGHELMIDSRDGDGDWVRHATGRLERDDLPAADVAEWAVEWPPPGAAEVPLADGYERLEASGYGYGPAFRGLRRLWRRGAELFAEVALAGGQAREADRYRVHPALLDAALHAGFFAADPGREGPARLPFAWTGVRLHAHGVTSARIRLMTPGDGEEITVAAADELGLPLWTVDSLVTRPAGADGADRRLMLDALFVPSAAPIETGTAPVPRLVPLAEVPEEGDVPAYVVYRVAPDGADPVADTHRATTRMLELVQTWLTEERFRGARLVVLTRDGDLAGAAVRGLCSSVQSEHPDRVVLADLDDHPASADVLAAAVTTGEPRLRIRRGTVSADRLARFNDYDVIDVPAGPGPWRLENAGGTLASVTAVPHEPEPLGPGQVRVAVRAAGLNFRDVIVALDMVAGQRGLGGDIAGVVSAVGPGVTDLAPGDRVLGLCAASIGPEAVTDRRFLAPMPAGWTFAQAATVPITHLTAWYGLVDLGAVKPGEAVLVHAAAGGVGIAAVQLARHLGAEVFGTASTGKHATLRAHGLDDGHIGDSRTLDFRGRFLAATHGRGVDVVLDCLAGDFVDAGLGLLPRGGRFLEMGKTDKRDPRDVAAAHPGVAYQAYDILEAGPDRIQAMLTEILGLYAAGALRLPPVTARPVQRARESLRDLSQARLVGKAVLTLPPPLDPAGTVLITGGVGTLGGLVARHLVARHGVTRLLLTSRQGLAAPGALTLVAELAAAGAHADVAACDVTDEAAMAALLDGVPLTAVVHTAGALHDAPVAAQTPQSLAKVLRPKVDGATILHRLTRDRDLAAFVLFSSAAGTFGPPAQANYAAANAYLDALAEHRQALGLPGTSLAWGLWSERSGLTGHLGDADLARMTRAGMRPLSTEEGLALFDAALGAGLPVLLPARLGLTGLSGDVPPLLRGLVRAPSAPPSRAATATDGEALRARLGVVPPAVRRRLVGELVRSHAAAVLGHAGTDLIQPERSFKDLGFDSLTAVEFRNRLGAATGLRLPSTLVFQFPNAAALTTQLVTDLAPAQEDPVDAALAVVRSLGTTLADLAAADRERVAAQLRTLLDMRGPDDDAQGLDAASNDDLFDLVDRGFVA